jgi:predicted amidohydrolase YtcJ
VLPADILTVSEEELMALDVTQTYLQGELVYER